MSYLKGLADRISKEDTFTQEIDIDDLIPSSENFYGIRDIEDLVASIKETGLLHNLVVRKTVQGMYEILSGERRYQALKQLGYKKVPCKVVDLPDIDAEILLIQANARQRELTPSEKMKGITKLKELYSLKRKTGEELPKGVRTRDLIGKDLGLSGSQVAKYQAIEKNLIDPLKEKLDKGDITLTQATTLSSLKDTEQTEIHNQIKNIDSKESKAEVDILVNGIKQPVERKEDKADDSGSNKPDVKQGAPMFINLQKLLDYDPFPKLVLEVMAVKAILYTKEIVMEPEDNLNLYHSLKIKLSGMGRDNIIIIHLARLDKVESIPNGLKPKLAYEINTGVYLWFKRKEKDE